MKHLVVFSKDKIEGLLAGEVEYDFRFFRKREEFLSKISIGDTVFFREKRGEVLGQFEIGKIFLLEGVKDKDWLALKNYLQKFLNEVTFKHLIDINKILLIIQINKLEQLITSPVEIDKKSKKEWVILD